MSTRHMDQALTNAQEYQISACTRELKDGATYASLRRVGYAAGAIQAAQEIIKQQEANQ